MSSFWSETRRSRSVRFARLASRPVGGSVASIRQAREAGRVFTDRDQDTRPPTARPDTSGDLDGLSTQPAVF